MANSKIYFKSEAGGTTTLSRDTTANSGNLVLPASGNVASVDTAVTDNAIARYDSTTGKLQNSGVIVDDNGNVGIGTGSPATALNVNTASETKCGLYLQKNLSSVAVFGAESTWLGTGTSNNAVLAAYGTNSLILGTNGSERMRINSNGNVGIGTSNPGARLQVVGSYTVGGYNNVACVFGAAVISELYIGSKNGNNPFIGSGGAYTLSLCTNGSERLILDSVGNVLVTSPAGLGYGTGAGGIVTQLTSKSTAVTLNKPCGHITMNNAALAAGASVLFAFYNSTHNIDYDQLIVNMHNVVSGHSNYRVENAGSIGGGGVMLRLTNISGASLSESPSIKFTVIKGAFA